DSPHRANVEPQHFLNFFSLPQGHGALRPTLTAVSAVIAYVAGIAATRRLGARLASFTGMAEVLFAVLYAWLLLGQMPSPADLTGGVLMLTGVILIRADDSRWSALGRADDG